MNAKLTCLVACGGLSTRMKTDKSLLKYYDKPQRYHLYDLLTEFCTKVFISSNKDQAKDIPEKYKYIVDKNEFAGHGPVSGLLSAFSQNTGDAILFIGCDYPLISENDFRQLIESRNKVYKAICFSDKTSMQPEPLLALYENPALHDIFSRFQNGRYSLREYLQQAKIKMLFPENPSLTKSIDTIEEYGNFTKSWS